jgi:hypothetical protein
VVGAHDSINAAARFKATWQLPFVNSIVSRRRVKQRSEPLPWILNGQRLSGDVVFAPNPKSDLFKRSNYYSIAHDLDPKERTKGLSLKLSRLYRNSFETREIIQWTIDD